METYEYIVWIHMGSQEPGTGTKLAAGPNGPGSHGPWPRARVPGTPPPVLGQCLALGPPYVSILNARIFCVDCVFHSDPIRSDSESIKNRFGIDFV